MPDPGDKVALERWRMILGRFADAGLGAPGDSQLQRMDRALDYLYMVGEVAIAMGRSVHATESLLSRARASLRHAYEATSDVPSGDAAPTSPEDAR